MAVKLDGIPVAMALRQDLSERVRKLTWENNGPTILIIRVGENADQISYEKSILKNCNLIGIKSVVNCLPLDITQNELEQVIEQANVDNSIHGILLFRPLPSHLDLEIIRKMINPIKDIDCMSPVNMGRLFKSYQEGIAPCTPKAVMELLKYYNIPLSGTDITVVGASLVVGRPLAMLLIDQEATVSVCHKFTQDVSVYTKRAEVVITACGVSKLFDERYFSEDSIVIDVGINYDKNGKLCGDVDYEAVFQKVKAITPTLGGIGIITTTILLSHVVEACEILSR